MGRPPPGELALTVRSRVRGSLRMSTWAPSMRNTPVTAPFFVLTSYGTPSTHVAWTIVLSAKRGPVDTTRFAGAPATISPARPSRPSILAGTVVKPARMLGLEGRAGEIVA